MTSSIRLNGCLSKDINEIAKTIIYCKFGSDEEITNAIKTYAKSRAQSIISKYNLSYCQTIIKVHANNNIFQAIMRSRANLSYSSELNFYKTLIFPYVNDIIFNKIDAAYKFERIPRIVLTEQIECSICLSEITDARTLYITPCRHHFHVSCMQRLRTTATRNVRCPNCRGNI